MRSCETIHLKSNEPSLSTPITSQYQKAIWLVCLLCGGLLFSHGAYLWAKAQLAQVLIARAWQTALLAEVSLERSSGDTSEMYQQAQKVKPWPWADTYPVAKIQFAEQSLYVLAGASGRTMAFGPGHMSATPLPFQGGNSVFTGHRDSHFASLAQLNKGDVIDVQTLAGQGQYRITAIFVVHQSQMHIIESNNQDQLTLLTCYPFNSLTPNPTLRFVVSAQRVFEG